MRADNSKHVDGGDWFDLETYNPQHKEGFVKHGFILSMYCLMRAKERMQGEVYSWAMHQVLKLAGDTDTNCAIVGGVIGAYAGVGCIPKS